MQSLLRNVVRHSGTGAFSQDLISSAVQDVLAGDERETCSNHDRMYPLVVSVLRNLAERTDMVLSDVLGQILLHRRANLKHRHHRKIADDMSWVSAGCSGDDGEDIFSGPLDE